MSLISVGDEWKDYHFNFLCCCTPFCFNTKYRVIRAVRRLRKLLENSNHSFMSGTS